MHGCRLSTACAQYTYSLQIILLFSLLHLIINTYIHSLKIKKPYIGSRLNAIGLIFVTTTVRIIDITCVAWNHDIFAKNGHFLLQNFEWKSICWLFFWNFIIFFPRMNIIPDLLLFVASSPIIELFVVARVVMKWIKWLSTLAHSPRARLRHICGIWFFFQDRIESNAFCWHKYSLSEFHGFVRSHLYYEWHYHRWVPRNVVHVVYVLHWNQSVECTTFNLKKLTVCGSCWIHKN